MNDWLQYVPLSPKGAQVRRILSVWEFNHLQTSIEHLALVTERPIAEVADRLLCSFTDMLHDIGTDTFLALLDDIAAEHEDEGEP